MQKICKRLAIVQVAFSVPLLRRRTIGIVIPYYTESKKGVATGVCAGCAAQLARAPLQCRAFVGSADPAPFCCRLFPAQQSCDYISVI